MLTDRVTDWCQGLRLQAWFFCCSAWELPFSIPLCIQCILHGLTSDLLCVPFIFFSGSKKSIDFSGNMWWLSVHNKSFLHLIVATFIAQTFLNSSWFVILCDWVEHSWQWWLLSLVLALMQILCISSMYLVLYYPYRL